MSHDFGAFLAIAAVVIVTPGQDTALVICNALAAGQRGGSFTALGVSAGQAIWTMASAAGLTALLLASAPAFAALKLVGAATLVFLGVRSLIDAFASRGNTTPSAPARDTGPMPPRVAFRQGLLSALGNPKLAVFFVSLLPQFVPVGSGSLAVLLGLGLVFCTLTLTWLAAYAAVVGRGSDLLGRAGVRRMFEAVLGAVLVGFGVRLAAEQR